METAAKIRLDQPVKRYVGNEERTSCPLFSSTIAIALSHEMPLDFTLLLTIPLDVCKAIVKLWSDSTAMT